jgi:biotin carboxyl carrier protein
MRYAIEIGEEVIEVEAVRLGPNRFRVQIGDAPARIIDGDLSEGLAHLVDGDRSWSVRLGARGEEVHGHTSGRGLVVRVQDERRRKQRAAEAAAAAGGGGRRSIRSPMPGKVVKVLVAAGQAVVAGQGVVIVEAMKMENELKAASPGTVVEVKCAEGALVEGNAELIVIEG